MRLVLKLLARRLMPMHMIALVSSNSARIAAVLCL